MPKRVLLESPYKTDNPKDLERNIKYARACMNDCFKRGEFPFASHLLYPQEGILRDDIPEERRLGIEAGLSWGSLADLTVVYTNLGITAGMQQGIQRAKSDGRNVEYRGLEGWENSLN